MTVAVAIMQPPTKDALLHVDVAVVPQKRAVVGRKHFDSFQASTLATAIEGVRSRFPDDQLAFGLSKPFARFEEIPLPAKIPPREITRAIRSRIQALGFDKADDVRIVRWDKSGATRYFVACMTQEERKTVLGAGKVKTIEYLAYGWARATTGVSVLIDATNAKQGSGWVDLAILAAPRADLVSLPWDSTAIYMIEGGITEASRAGFFATLPTVIHYIDPNDVLPKQTTIAGATLAPLPSPLPPDLAHYASVLAIAGAHR